MKTVLRGLIPAIVLCFPVLGFAQDPEIERLQQRLDELTAQVESLRQEMARLRGTAPEEDLTAIETVDTPILDAQLVPNITPAGASKIFNPDIAAIGNFVAFLGTTPGEAEPVATLEEAELSFQAFVDPYAKANFFIAVSEEGAEVEEGFINFITLPQDITAKVGKMKANFGKVNLQHTHQRLWIDVPLVNAAFFGEEGLADSGVSISKLLPSLGGMLFEATGEIFSGNAEGVFESEQRSDLFYLGHLKLFRDLTENSNLEFGGSYATGRLPELGGSNDFAGLDLTYRYKPLQRAIYNSFISRTEVMFNDRDNQEDNAAGFYTSADYQFSRRWFAGVRLDQVDRPDDPSFTDRSGSFTLTFWPSEFSQIRAQFRHINFDQSDDANELLLQLNFSIGAHGAHTF